MIRDPRAAQPRLRPVSRRSKLAQLAYLLGVGLMLAGCMAIGVFL